MKKASLYLLFALFGAMMFASCKKDYTCECRVGIPLAAFDTTIAIEIEDVKKKQAKVACENNETSIPASIAALLAAAINSGGGFDSSFTGFGSGIPAGLFSADCELK